MIIQITGNVNYTITLDPTVWIFDERKVLLDDAFSSESNEVEKNKLDKIVNRWHEEVYQQNTSPPVNKGLNRIEREQALSQSFVMPIDDFLENAEMKSDAKNVTLKTIKGKITVPLINFQNCYLLFAINGKPIKDDGPVHIYFKDGSNKDHPIKGVKKIIIN